MALWSISVISCANEKEIDIYFMRLSTLTKKLDTINLNITNAQTTRTKEGGAYRPRDAKNCKNGLCEIIYRPISEILKYEPSHPDAQKNGYVKYPAINVMQEMQSLIKLQRAIEYLQDDPPVSKSFFYGPKIEHYLKKYPGLKGSYNFNEFLKE